MLSGCRRSVSGAVHVKLAQFAGVVVAAGLVVGTFGIVVGFRQHLNELQPPGGHERSTDCKRKISGAGHVKLAHVDGLAVPAELAVGCRQQKFDPQPPGSQVSISSWGRGTIGEGHEKVAHVAGVAETSGVVVGSRQH